MLQARGWTGSFTAPSSAELSNALKCKSVFFHQNVFLVGFAPTPPRIVPFGPILWLQPTYWHPPPTFKEADYASVLCILCTLKRFLVNCILHHMYIWNKIYWQENGIIVYIAIRTFRAVIWDIILRYFIKSGHFSPHLKVNENERK